MKVKDNIDESLRNHEPYIVIDYDWLNNFPDIDESEGEDEGNDFNMVDLDLIDFNVVLDGDLNNISVPSGVEGLLPLEQFYSMCSQLNDA